MKTLARTRRAWQSPFVIALLALALRLLFVALLYRDTWNDFGDHILFGFETGRIARSIASGHGFGNPLSVQTGPTAWMTPLYPYLLAGVFKIFGIYSRTSAIVILSLNGLFSALICIPVYFAAQRSFGLRAAIFACWLWALLPYSIYIASSFVWETCLSALLLAILFLWTLQLREKSHSHWEWLGYGGLWGLGALSNPSMLSVAPFLAGWAIFPIWRSKRGWLTSALLVAIGLCVPVIPWQVRNHRALHAVIPLRDAFWVSAWIGNDGNTAHQADISVHPSINEAAQAEYERLGEIAYMREAKRRALDYVRRHPGFFVVMCLRRFAYFWTGFWNADPSNLAVEFYDPALVLLTLPSTVLLLVGLWRAFRSARDAALPYFIVLGIYPLVFYVTDPEIRYRHLIDPQIIVLAGLGASFLISELIREFPLLEAQSHKHD